MEPHICGLHPWGVSPYRHHFVLPPGGISPLVLGASKGGFRPAGWDSTPICGAVGDFTPHRGALRLLGGFTPYAWGFPSASPSRGGPHCPRGGFHPIDVGLRPQRGTSLPMGDFTPHTWGSPPHRGTSPPIGAPPPPGAPCGAASLRRGFYPHLWGFAPLNGGLPGGGGAFTPHVWVSPHRGPPAPPPLPLQGGFPTPPPR